MSSGANRSMAADNGAKLTPPIDRTRVPPFHELPDKSFERFTRDLLDYEPGIVSADLYNTPRKPQFGIDVLARRSDGCREVASCKCYKAIRPGDLQKWSNDCLDHWDGHWKPKNVVRFILAVTAPIEARARSEEIDAESERFAKLGLAYEVWGPAQLQKRVRPHRALAEQFLGPYWADIVCGSPLRTLEATKPSSIPANVDVADLETLRSAFSGLAERQIEDALEKLRRGDLDPVASLVIELRVAPTWPQLDAPTRARVIRLQANIAILEKRLDDARTLLSEADGIAPPPDRRMWARLALQEHDLPSALKVLGSPTSYEACQFRVSLLLSNGEIDEAERLLDAVDKEKQSDPENHRLRAFVHLFRNRRQDALDEVQQAEAGAPDWLAVVRTGAMVRYALALSPKLPLAFFIGANPVDLDLVKEDPQSRSYLAEALERFDSLYRRQRPDLEDAVFKLACLANDRDRQGEAEEFASQLLSRDPGNVGVVVWCLARGYNLDKGASLERLSARFRGAELEPWEIRVLGWLMSEQDNSRAALETIEAGLPLQVGSSREEAEAWRARFAGLPNPPENSPTTVEPFHLVQEASQTGNWEALAPVLARLIDESSPAAFPVAQSLAGAQQWHFLAPHLDNLLRFETLSAYRLVAYTAVNTGAPKQALEILGRYFDQLGQGQLPADLQRLRVGCFAQLGHFPEARAEAERLSARTSELSDKLLKAQLDIAMGDVASAVPVAREALVSAELASPAALRLSSAIRTVDPALSESLFKRALRQGIDGPAITTALWLGFALGLDEEANRLLPDLHRRAAEGARDVVRYSIDDIPKLLEESAATRAIRQQDYADGHMPAHLYAQAENANLGALLWFGSADDPGPLRGLPIRSAARPANVDVGLPWNQWSILLDITGLLVAEQTGLLDLLEQHPNPITVSPLLPQALLQLEQDALPNQPSRVSAAERILHAHKSGKIAVRAPDGPGGIRVVHEPETPAPNTVGLATVYAFIHASDGSVDGVQPDRDLVETSSTEPSIAAGDRLFFEGNTLEGIASAGDLDRVSASFVVEIDGEALRRLEWIIEAASQSQKVAAWLSRLRSRLLQNLGTGQFVFCPAKPADEHNELIAKLRPTAVTASLFDILAAPTAPGVVLWVEDRYVSNHPMNGQACVVGTYEVIRALEAAGLISPPAAREALGRLRDAGAVFLPIHPKQLADMVASAPLTEGARSETAELSGLRRNFATAMRLDRHLKIEIPEAGHGEPAGDAAFLIAARNLAQDTLSFVWNDPELSIERCLVASEYVWANFRADRLTRVLVEGQDEAAFTENATTLAVVSLINRAVQIGSLKRREAFLAWVDDAVLTPRASIDTDFLQRVADRMKSLFLALLDHPQQLGASLEQLQTLVHLQLRPLPARLRQLFLNDQVFTNRIGLETSSQLVLGGLAFDATEAWTAVASAMRGGSSRLQSLDGNVVGLRRRERGVEFRGALRGRLQNAFLPVLRAREAAQPKAVERFLSRLDLPPDRTAEYRSRIEAEDALLAQVGALEEAGDASTLAMYERLERAIQPRAAIPMGAFKPPSLSSLMHHLRLGGSGDFRTEASRAWDELLQGYGIRTALERLGGLPLPTTDWIGGQEPAGKAQAFTEITRRARTPVALAHAAALERSLSGAGSQDFATLVDRLVDVTVSYGDLLVELLSWSERTLSTETDWERFRIEDRLAFVWTHADRVLGILVSRGIEPEAARKIFAGCRPERSLGTLFEPDALDRNRAAPTNLTAQALLAYLLANAFGDEPLSLSPSATMRFEAFVPGKISEPHRWFLFLFPRSLLQPDAMGSFIGRIPVGLLPHGDDLERVRDATIRHSLDLLEADACSAEGWLRLFASILPIDLDAETSLRIAGLFRENSPSAITRANPDVVGLARVLFSVAVRTEVAVDETLLLEKLKDLTCGCAGNAHVAVRQVPLPISEAVTSALTELFECSGQISASAGNGDRSTRFARCLGVISDSWPGLRPWLRTIMDRLLRRESPSNSLDLFKMDLLLRACA